MLSIKQFNLPKKFFIVFPNFQQLLCGFPFCFSAIYKREESFSKYTFSLFNYLLLRIVNDLRTARNHNMEKLSHLSDFPSNISKKIMFKSTPH